MKIVHHYADGCVNWLISGQQSVNPSREAISILSGKHKRFTFVHPVNESKILLFVQCIIATSFSCFFRNTIQCSVRYQLYNSQRLIFFQCTAYNKSTLKLQLHDAIYRLRFYSNSLIRILLLSNSHNNVASIQKNRGDKSRRVTVALGYVYTGSDMF